MAKKDSSAEYLELIEPQGYVANRDITLVGGRYLVPGSKNTLIKNREKVTGRKGYELFGAAKTLDKGIVSNKDWQTSTGVERNLRSYFDTLEVYYDDAWRELEDGFSNKVNFNCEPWWDSSELIDVLLLVNGTDEIREWSGGISRVASVTANTITKKGYLAGATIAFNDNGAGQDTITDSANGFVTAGFEAGNTIVISGSATNDGTYIISSVTAGVITLVVDESLLTEPAGASVVVKWAQEGTWAEARFLTSNTRGTRRVVIDGVAYAYTGGEGTGTLTGVTPDPSAGGVTANDIAFQQIRVNALAQFGTDSYKADIVSIFNNHAFYGSNSSRVVWIADSSNFTDLGYTTPLRVPGEGFELVLDSVPTAFAPDLDAMYVSAGRDDWYKINMELTADQSGESIRVKKLKTSPGQAARSQGAIVRIKNNVAFMSFEPTFDTLGEIENIVTQQTLPISDPIKDELELYNLTDIHGIYHNRNIYITLPRESLVLIFDVLNQHWQPPQTLAISRFAIIDGVLCGHSSGGNETYTLFSGYNDNGVAIPMVAAFGYDNFGTRMQTKRFDEVANEVLISRNTILETQLNYDYRGSGDIRVFEIDGSWDDNTVFSPNVSASLGQQPFGNQPFGSLSEEIEDLVKIRVVFDTPALDFFERQRVFKTSTLDARFQVLAYGENVTKSENHDNFIHK
jgi:hypothetical protein